MSTSRVFVSNIPEKLQKAALIQLLQTTQIPYTNQDITIQTSKRKTNDGQSTGRFTILSFENDQTCNFVIDAINNMVVTVEGQDKQMRATQFIPNFKNYLTNPVSNLVINNIPAELAQNDLRDLFQEFGTVLSAYIKPQNPAHKKDSQMGYVLFAKKEEAETALQQANGKFLGPKQLFITKYKTMQQRFDENDQVMLHSMPQGISEAEVKSIIADEFAKLPVDQTFKAGTPVSVINDARPEEINSHGAMVIFTAASVEVAKAIIANCAAANKQFEGVTGEVTAVMKLTRGMKAYLKLQKVKENREKYVDSGKNIQVYGAKMETAEETVSQFFSKYGKIAEISMPKRADVDENFFHFNVLFETKEAADMALAHAAEDEKTFNPRFAKDALIISRYEQKTVVQSSDKRHKKDNM